MLSLAHWGRCTVWKLDRSIVAGRLSKAQKLGRAGMWQTEIVSGLVQWQPSEASRLTGPWADHFPPRVSTATVSALMHRFWIPCGVVVRMRCDAVSPQFQRRSGQTWQGWRDVCRPRGQATRAPAGLLPGSCSYPRANLVTSFNTIQGCFCLCYAREWHGGYDGSSEEDDGRPMREV